MLTHTYVLGVYIGVIVVLAGMYTVAATCDAKFQIITGHSACSAVSSSLGYSIAPTDVEIAEIVDRHNYHRANVAPTATNMLKMNWDEELAMVAQAWADTCVFGHDNNYERIIPGSSLTSLRQLKTKFTWDHHRIGEKIYSNGSGRYQAGQNAYMTSSSEYNWTEVIDAWHSEVNHFTYGVGSTSTAAVGHYTQIVWADSHKVGCGGAYCSNFIIYCNYSPPGNSISTQYTPYISGASCSDCPNSCSDNLCDCSSQDCYNGGTLDVDTCQCSCKNSASYYVGQECALNCTGIGTPYCGFTAADCLVYSNVPFDCPVTCGFCPDADSTHLLTDGGGSGSGSSGGGSGSGSGTGGGSGSGSGTGGGSGSGTGGGSGSGSGTGGGSGSGSGTGGGSGSGSGGGSGGGSADGTTGLDYACYPNGTIDVTNPDSGTYVDVLAVQDEGDSSATKCSVDSSGSQVLITGCAKDTNITVFFSNAGDEVVFVGETLKAFTIMCSEIPATGVTRIITQSLGITLALTTEDPITPSFSVTSAIRSTSATGSVVTAASVGDTLYWTIDIPSDYNGSPTCTAYSGTSISGSPNAQLISDGCTVDSGLCDSFDNELAPSTHVKRIWATLYVFRFYDSDALFLACSVKVCPSTSSDCDLACDRRKRGTARNQGIFDSKNNDNSSMIFTTDTQLLISGTGMNYAGMNSFLGPSLLLLLVVMTVTLK